jgi:peptide-methionine (R)-S-oxide reductase
MPYRRSQKVIEKQTGEHGPLPETEIEYSVSRGHNDHTEPGIYVDIVSCQPLFASSDRYAVGCGWPTFTRPIVSTNIKALRDTSCGMIRTEVRSTHSDTHLGYVFPDGPPNLGGLRYSINYTSLRFVHRDDMEHEGYAEYLNRAK